MSNDAILWCLVVFIIAVPGLVETSFERMKEHEQQELAVGGTDYHGPRETADLERVRTVESGVGERTPITFAFVSSSKN